MHAEHARVLLVERDPATQEALERALQREGLSVIWARTAAEAEAAAAAEEPRLVILNPRLSPDDGWLVYRSLRRRHLPIMLVTQRHDPGIERVALTLGADDCVAGTAGPDEVARRARFLLHRMPEVPAVEPSFGDVTLDAATGSASVAGAQVPLTRTEYALLRTLVEARGGVVSREQLVLRARAHAGALPLARSIETHIRSLRRKLGDDGDEPARLLAVRGFGYRLVAPRVVAPERLALEAFQALPDPIIVIDGQQRIQLMNRAAERLVGQAADGVVGRLSCGVLLRCHLKNETGVCSGLATLADGAAHSGSLVVCPSGHSLAVEEKAVPLASTGNHVLLRLTGKPA